MKGEWKVSQNYIGKIVWQVYRSRNVGALDHAGNREYADGVFSTEAEAQAYADYLNAEEQR